MYVHIHTYKQLKMFRDIKINDSSVHNCAELRNFPNVCFPFSERVPGAIGSRVRTTTG